MVACWSGSASGKSHIQRTDMHLDSVAKQDRASGVARVSDTCKDQVKVPVDLRKAGVPVFVQSYRVSQPYERLAIAQRSRVSNHVETSRLLSLCIEVGV